jgi:hypothetical protein
MLMLRDVTMKATTIAVEFVPEAKRLEGVAGHRYAGK